MVGTVPVPEVEGDAAASVADDPSAARLPPRGPNPRGPALIVLGIAVVIVVVGLVGSALASNNSGAPTPGPAHEVTLPDGTSVTLTPASTALRSLVSEGQPPSDVLDHLVVPAGSRSTGTVNNSQSAGQYDETADFATSQAGDEVVDTFKAVLPKLGWQLLYTGPGLGVDRSGTEVLAKRGSSDGYEWEVGVVVSPTTAAGTTPFSVEVFELSDDT
jgi:hypothetical protein